MRILVAMMLLFTMPASAAVSVVDGDTIRIDGIRTRLWGFDAPERRQRCVINGVDRAIGQEASEGLEAILAGGELRCEVRDHDHYGRAVAECWVDGQSIADQMVRHGWAWALPRFSGDRFLAAQEEAERTHRGIWAGDGCEAPARFRDRQRHREPPPPGD